MNRSAHLNRHPLRKLAHALYIDEVDDFFGVVVKDIFLLEKKNKKNRNINCGYTNCVLDQTQEHYENLPMQHKEIYKVVRNEIFQSAETLIFFLFLLKT